MGLSTAAPQGQLANVGLVEKGDRAMDDLLNREHNGWENKWTWLVHLHLSNEQEVYLEIARMVESEPNNGPAAGLVEMWVKSSIEHWLTAFPGRNTSHDETIRLLVWDMVGAALAYAEWDKVVLLLMGYGKTQHNLFTATLFRNMVHTDEVFHQISLLLKKTAIVGVAADMLKEGFEEQLSEWIELAAVGLHIGFLYARTFSELVVNTYVLVFWEHVARAFRP